MKLTKVLSKVTLYRRLERKRSREKNRVYCITSQVCLYIKTWVLFIGYKKASECSHAMNEH